MIVRNACFSVVNVLGDGDCCYVV